MSPLSPAVPLVVAVILAAVIPGAEPPAALERVALTGASVTDGFLIPHEVDAMVSMSDTFAAACTAEIEPPLRRSSAMFFLDPERHAEAYVAQITRHDPSLVIAVDFLFWFSFGWHFGGEEGRLESLERGLGHLSSLSCPLVIGDIPDVSDAAVNGVGIHGAPMIHPGQVPKAETRELLNRRIREWAAERDHVHVVPLAEFFDRLSRGEAFAVRDIEVEADTFDRFMDSDRLHPNFAGLTLLTALIADTLVTAELAPADAFHWDLETIQGRVLAARAEERAIRTRR